MTTDYMLNQLHELRNVTRSVEPCPLPLKKVKASEPVNKHIESSKALLHCILKKQIVHVVAGRTETFTTQINDLLTRLYNNGFDNGLKTGQVIMQED